MLLAATCSDISSQKSRGWHVAIEFEKEDSNAGTEGEKTSSGPTALLYSSLALKCLEVVVVVVVVLAASCKLSAKIIQYSQFPSPKDSPTLAQHAILAPVKFILVRAIMVGQPASSPTQDGTSKPKSAGGQGIFGGG